MADYATIIIGAGPAGLFTAARTAACPVLLLERNPTPGRKLCLTGGGRCNFTHEGPIRDFPAAYGVNGRFLKPALQNFSNHAIRDFFLSQGVASRAEAEGKIFPAAGGSQAILTALMAACRKPGVTLAFNERVRRVDAAGPGRFTVTTEKKIYHSPQVVLATGGCAYPSTGSTGDGHRFAEHLGLIVTPPRPGLTPLLIRDHPWKHLSGTSLHPVEAALWRSGKPVARRQGALLFTHQGLSGPVILNLSHAAQPGDTVTLAFWITPDREEARRSWLQEIEAQGRAPAKSLLARFALTQALSLALLASAGIAPHTKAATLSRQQRLRLFEGLTGFPLTVDRPAGFETAMVSSGGVAWDEINPGTLGARRRPGLYLIGDVLDLEAETGGFALQAAWSSAALVARQIEK